MSPTYGPDELFASAKSEENHVKAVDALLRLTGSTHRAEAEYVVTAIAAYIMRDLADRRTLVRTVIVPNETPPP